MAASISGFRASGFACLGGFRGFWVGGFRFKPLAPRALKLGPQSLKFKHTQPRAIVRSKFLNLLRILTEGELKEKKLLQDKTKDLLQLGFRL